MGYRANSLAQRVKKKRKGKAERKIIRKAGLLTDISSRKSIILLLYFCRKGLTTTR